MNANAAGGVSGPTVQVFQYDGRSYTPFIRDQMRLPGNPITTQINRGRDIGFRNRLS